MALSQDARDRRRFLDDEVPIDGPDICAYAVGDSRGLVPGPDEEHAPMRRGQRQGQEGLGPPRLARAAILHIRHDADDFEPLILQPSST
jgi:hypothetical protein